jgi:hypothetical protein
MTTTPKPSEARIFLTSLSDLRRAESTTRLQNPEGPLFESEIAHHRINHLRPCRLHHDSAFRARPRKRTAHTRIPFSFGRHVPERNLIAVFHEVRRDRLQFLAPSNCSGVTNPERTLSDSSKRGMKVGHLPHRPTRIGEGHLRPFVPRRIRGMKVQWAPKV